MIKKRYRPKKYEHYRRRRLLHRLLPVGAVVLLVCALGAGGFFLWRSMGNTAEAGASASPMQTSTPFAISASPMSTASAAPRSTASAVGSAQAAVTAKPTPSAAPSATPSPSPSPTATPKATATPGPVQTTDQVLNPAGMTIETRFNPPKGYQRVALESGSFGAWLRGQAVLADGTAPKRWDGREASGGGVAAVLAMEVTSLLQQNTETAVRLHAQYQYERGQHQNIVYHFASGFLFKWDSWRAGGRVHTYDNPPVWRSEATEDSSVQTFYDYLQVQYNYTNINSLMKYDLTPVTAANLRPGDMLVNPKGSVAIVADMVVNPADGSRLALLLSGGRPASQITVPANAAAKASPWFPVPADGKGSLVIGEYHYDWSQLGRFRS